MKKNNKRNPYQIVYSHVSRSDDSYNEFSLRVDGHI